MNKKSHSPLLSALSLMILLFILPQSIPADNTEAQSLYKKGTEYRHKDLRKAYGFYKKALEKDSTYIDALNQAGLTACKLGEFDAGLDYFKKAEGILKNRGQTETEPYASTLRGFGIVFTNRGQIETALEYYWKAIGLLEKIRKEKSQLYAQLLLSIANTTKNEDPDSALKLIQDAEVLSKELSLGNDHHFMYRLYNNYGNVVIQKKQPNLALDHYGKAKIHLEKGGFQNTPSMGGLLNNFGWAFYHLKKYDQALDYYLESKTLYEKLSLQKTTNYIIVLLNLGVIHYQNKDYKDGIDIYLKAKSLLEQLKVTKQARYANTLYYLGMLYANLGWQSGNRNDLQESIAFYLETERLYKELKLDEKKPNHYSSLLNNIAKIYHRKKTFREAQDYYTRAKNIMEKTERTNTQGYGFLLYDLASVCWSQRKNSLAGQYYREAYEVFERIGYQGQYKEKARQNAEKLGH